MSRKALIDLFSLLLALLLFIPSAGDVRAQDATTKLSIYGLQVDTFPTISGGMDIYDAAGDFLSGLTVDDVTLLEDDRELDLDQLQEMSPGVDFVVALNTGPAFARRDAYGVSRLDTLRVTLQDWADSAGDQGDDLSLLAVGAEDATHLDQAGFQAAVAAYQLDARTLLPTYDTFSRAIDLAGARDPLTGEKGAVLWITSLPEANDFSLLESLTTRANQMDVRVFVWIVTDADRFTLAGATALRDVAIRTGGTHFAFSGSESLPSLETYLAPLRHTYAFRYTSAATSTGSHTLTLSVEYEGQPLNAVPLSFDLLVSPPNPVIVSPPVQIIRQPADENSTDPLAFVPSTWEIEMLIEFPDGHPREIARTALYVDGQLVDENKYPPYDTFTWELSDYLTSGQYLLQVEAEDTLGLSQVSLGFPVTITVLQPPGGFLAFLQSNAPGFSVAAVLLAGVVLALVMARGSLQKLRARRESVRRYRDPVTQPVNSTALHQRSLVWAKAIKPAPAYLIRLRADGQDMSASPIPLFQDEITFGNDPTRATNMLDDPSISSLHARLQRGSDDEFFINDEGSVAGTWVNYELVQAPRLLAHGDVIHIGRISYRFMLRSAPKRIEPRVEPLQK